MIFLPLTVAATVLSGEFELDEQAAPNAATMPISTERVKSFENLCTSFAPYNVGQRLAPAYSLAKNWLASCSTSVTRLLRSCRLLCIWRTRAFASRLPWEAEH